MYVRSQIVESIRAFRLRFDEKALLQIDAEAVSDEALLAEVRDRRAVIIYLAKDEPGLERAAQRAVPAARMNLFQRRAVRNVGQLGARSQGTVTLGSHECRVQ